MECKIHVYLLNEHFSQEHADANFGGKPSENNRKYEWEDEMKITSHVTDVNIHEKASFPLAGELPSGETFSYDIPQMRLFEIISEGQQTTFVGCSESILEDSTLEKLDDLFVISIYIKDFEPFSNPVPGIYIAAQEFPKELIF
jgi:hypothetical protein